MFSQNEVVVEASSAIVCPLHLKLFNQKLNTTWKVTKFGGFLVRIFSHLDRIRRILCKSPSSVWVRESTDQKNSKFGYFSRNDKLPGFAFWRQSSAHGPFFSAILAVLNLVKKQLFTKFCLFLSYINPLVCLHLSLLLGK